MERKYFANFNDPVDSPVIEIPSPRMDRQIFVGDKMLVAKNVLKAGVVVPAHKHPHEQISVVIRGECDVITYLESGPVKQHCTAGGLALFPGDVEHEVRISPDTDCEIWDLFSPVREEFIPKD